MVAEPTGKQYSFLGLRQGFSVALEPVLELALQGKQDSYDELLSISDHNDIHPIGLRL